MSVQRQADGSWVVDAEIIGPAFNLAPASVPELMRNGQITSRHELGEGENSGRSRLTFFYGTQAYRLTIDDGGQILSRATYQVTAR